MIYPIVAYGDPVLKKVAQPIVKDSELDVKQLIEDMFETMYSSNGVGIAAPQIGLSVRLFVMDPENMDEEDERLKGSKRAFINPKMIEETGDEWPFEEGCLSIPGIRGDVLRPQTITINYFDENWIEKTEKFSGLTARVIQHEYDHLEGKLFIDYLSAMKRRLIKNKLNDIKKGIVKADYRMKFSK